ncbi:MAG: vanadium-dependent haloperoxidase [Saprospiraceae bacterium]|nr:vanadium-dependent haloperoxidase [Saprospiraceae bacterium]
MRQLVHFKASQVNSLMALVIFLLTACTKEERATFSDDVNKSTVENGSIAIDWMRLAVSITPEIPGYTPPIAARAFGYLGLGLYESVAQGIDGYPSFQGKLNGLSSQSLPAIHEGGEVSWHLVVNESMHYLFGKFYRNVSPATRERIEAFYNEQKNVYSTGVQQDIIEKSLMYGAMMGKAIYNYSVTDGQDQAYLNNYPIEYSVPQGQGLWAPTSNHIKRPLLPYWGDVRCFMQHASAMEMPTPPNFSTDPGSQFYANALDVRNRVRNLDVNSETMVKFWNDDQNQSLTTAGHMMSILSDILSQESRDLAFTAKAFAKLGLSLHDATVAAWKVKYKYNILRPETYIKENIDRDFLPLVDPQATPEYSSSSSALGMASAEVLSEIFGFNYAFTDRTHENRKDIDGTPRSFKSFQQMADEIASSCLYGGIHYRFSLEAGQEQGAVIGKNINKIKI